VAISIFLIVVVMAVGTLTDSFASKRKIELSRTIYEEARIVLERIVKEVRRGTIDYEEYWNRFSQPYSTLDSIYGQNYGEYARQFYRDSGGNVPLVVTRLNENVGENIGNDPLEDANSLSVCQSPAVPSAITFGSSGYEQCELYLITAEGDEKTIIKLQNDSGEYRLTMLKLPGHDSDADGQIDLWKIYNGGTDPSPSKFYDFCSNYDSSNTCTVRQFQKIQPDSIKITSLKFFIAPREDPRKAFAEFTNDVQQQPHVTIELTAELSDSRVRGIRGNPPTVTLQTTVGARAQNEVKSF